MSDIPEIPGGATTVWGSIALGLGALAAGWRYFVTTRPSDANAAANSKEQIAAIEVYKGLLADERTAHAATATRAATELATVREAWARDVSTRTADLTAERTARLAAEDRENTARAGLDAAREELWGLRGQVKVMAQQIQELQATVARLQESVDGTPQG